MSHWNGKIDNKLKGLVGIEQGGITMWDKLIGAVVVAVATEVAKEIINENK